MPIEYQKWITRQDLQANPQKLYVFGDNFSEAGYGGQAREMRGEPNAVGIPTKVSPRLYLNDGWFYDCLHKWAVKFEYLCKAVESDCIIVFPADGIGTGLADLENKAPRCWKLLQLFMEDLEAYANEVNQGHDSDS
jgi:hypothetical protein